MREVEKAVSFDLKDRHRVLKEIYRNYITLRESYQWRSTSDVIQYGPILISIFDLQYGLNELAPRKKEAFFYHVICDMTQRDVAKIMGITPVSVGQYVKQACIQLSARYFSEEVDSE